MLTAPEEPRHPVTSVTDERLRLLFTCCHPALAPEARVALTLRLLGGLTVAEVSRIYHDDHAGAARLLRAPELAGTWKRWAERFAADASRARG